MSANPYDIEDDGCRCSAWNAGECACGNYLDPSWKRIWQQGFDAAVANSDAHLRRAVESVVDEHQETFGVACSTSRTWLRDWVRRTLGSL